MTLHPVAWAWLAVILFLAAIWCGIATMAGLVPAAVVAKLSALTVVAGTEAHVRLLEVTT